MGAKIPVKGDQFIIGSRRLATHACHRGSAIRTKVPGEFNHLPAVVADLFQAGMTVGAGHPIELHTAVAARADRGIFHRLQESFLLEGALILLLERAGGAQDEVDEDAREKEQHGDDHRQDAHEGVAGARTNIAVHPKNEAQPECRHEGSPEAGQEVRSIA